MLEVASDNGIHNTNDKCLKHAMMQIIHLKHYSWTRIGLTSANSEALLYPLNQLGDSKLNSKQNAYK